MGNNYSIAVVDHPLGADELAELGFVATGRLATVEEATSRGGAFDEVGVARTGGKTLLADASFVLAELADRPGAMRGQWYLAMSSDVSSTYLFSSVLDGVERGRALFLEAEGQWNVTGELPDAVTEFLTETDREQASVFKGDIVELPGELLGVPLEIELEVDVYSAPDPFAG